MKTSQMKRATIGIDIGGTHTRFALIDAEGHILYRSKTASRIKDGLGVFCEILLNGISETKNKSASRNLFLDGVGIGVPGLVDRDGVIHSSPNMPPLNGFNLSDFIQMQTALPCVCCNDANMIALGEYALGAARELDSFIVITIGTGLGSGLILEKRLWRGSNGFTAEFGHVTVEPEGISCPCGNKGCLERYVSAGAIARSAREFMKNEMSDATPDTAEEAAKLARQGIIEAQAAFAHSGRYLGIALASLVNTLDLQAAIICGGVSASLDLMLPSIRKELSIRCFPQIASNFTIIPGFLGDDAGILGAAMRLRSVLHNSSSGYA